MLLVVILEKPLKKFAEHFIAGKMQANSQKNQKSLNCVLIY